MAEPYNTKKIRIVGGNGIFAPNNSSTTILPVVTVPRNTFLDPTVQDEKNAIIDIFQNQWFSTGTDSYLQSTMYFVESIDDGEPQLVPTSRIVSIYSNNTMVTKGNPASILPLPLNYKVGTVSRRTYVTIDISTLPTGTGVYKLISTWGFH